MSGDNRARVRRLAGEGLHIHGRRACSRCGGSGIEPPGGAVKDRAAVNELTAKLGRMYDAYVQNGRTWEPMTGTPSPAMRLVELAAAVAEQRDRVRFEALTGNSHETTHHEEEP